MDVQKLINAMNDVTQNVRSEYHLTLGRAIEVMEKTIRQKEKEACDFYRDAFGGKSARIVRPDEKREFEISGVIEIDTGDKRGIIFVARVQER